jgi:xanthine/CO dehydrogenase XdhC/CoxF family maturation factor
MTARHLIAAFERWRESGRPLVLASVFETAGSTYSKAGAQMLINADGDFQGMLSGGCLEGDLAERARQVVQSGVPQSVTYDLSQNDEELWGLGVGCDGMMRIFLQPLTAANAYQPLASMCRAFAGDTAEIAATVLDPAAASGASWVSIEGQIVYSAIDPALEPGVRMTAEEVLRAGRSRTTEIAYGKDRRASVLFSILRPPPRILVLGGGLDARPVLNLASELGWRVIVQDHRPAYIGAGGFGDAEEVLCVPAEALAEHVDFARIDGVVVMSHHLATDRKYLELLAATGIPYIGLLGPANRRDRLLGELGGAAAALKGRLQGPAGIDIGASGPASIALSIVAEMQRVLDREVNAGKVRPAKSARSPG